MNTNGLPMCLAMALAVVSAVGLPATAHAQGAAMDSTAVAQRQQPTPSPGKTSQAGAFAKGMKRVGFYGGVGSTLWQTYVILGGGLSYFLADGLEAGADFEGWLFQSPTIWKLTPQVRYTLWQSPRFQPYIGAFYRRTFIGDPYEDYNSYGGRAGLTYRSGRGYAGAGVVYERFVDEIAGDRDVWYPEVSFALYF
jgi:hypothetical protein